MRLPPLLHPPEDHLNAEGVWRELRRTIFLLVAPLGALGALLGVFVQLPDVNPLDLAMLPLQAVVLLGLALLVLLRRIRVEMAFSWLYLLFALYFVLMLGQQARLNIGPWQHLSDANYWYAPLYGLAFLAWDTRRAAWIAAGTYLLTLLATAVALPDIYAHGQLSVGLIATLAQFYLASLTLVALLISFAVLKERAQQLRLMAYMDYLTGLPNRRHAEALLDRPSYGEAPLALVMFDLDHFKRVNDQFGHPVGDRVLREHSQLAARQLHSEQQLARWGGEEFLFLLPGLSAAEASALAERTRQALERSVVDGVGQVTASFGVAARLPGEPWPDALRRADLALYDAKNSGRNQVVTAQLAPEVRHEPEDGLAAQPAS